MISVTFLYMDAKIGTILRVLRRGIAESEPLNAGTVGEGNC